MFYLTKKEKIADIEVGERIMVLADFSGIQAGQKGHICENYKHGVMVEWDCTSALCTHGHFPRHDHPKMDGFGEDELEYLAFETQKHPTKAK